MKYPSYTYIPTHPNGTAVQHLQYLPYGEPFINQRMPGYSERCTSTGKERDSETGYGYFGARYMDHELMTMWTSVDPMSDKYPGMSPYNYCAWNPVKLVDPDGREIDGPPNMFFGWFRSAENKANKYMNRKNNRGLFEITDWEMSDSRRETCSVAKISNYDNSDFISTANTILLSEVSIFTKRKTLDFEDGWIYHAYWHILDNFENKIHSWFNRREGLARADELADNAQGPCSALASCVLGPVNSLYTIAKGEDVFGNKADGLDYVSSVVGIVTHVNGNAAKILNNVKKVPHGINTGVDILSSMYSGYSTWNGVQEKNNR